MIHSHVINSAGIYFSSEDGSAYIEYLGMVVADTMFEGEQRVLLCHPVRAGFKRTVASFTGEGLQDGRSAVTYTIRDEEIIKGA